MNTTHFQKGNHSRNILAATIMGVSCSSPVSANENIMLEEVVVTATKRAASVQDIPMSIEAVSGDKLDQQGIADFEDLSSTIPNFSVGEGVATTNIVMRGMGSGNNRAFEQSVGMFIDGVYMPRSRQYVAPFTDIDRVEVLRGPQAVMFGLNATAGSISVVSAKSNPGDEFHAEVTAEYELEYNGLITTSVIGGSPVDSLGIRLVYQNRDSGDGFVENTFTGDDVGQVASEIGRLTAVWEPTNELKVTTKLEYAEFEDNGSIGEVFGPNTAALDGGDGKLNWKNSSNASKLDQLITQGTGQEVRSNNAMVNIDYMLGEHTLTAVLASSDFDYRLGVDLDSSASLIAIPGFGTFSIDAVAFETYEQQSAELRWTSPAGETLEYIAGVYYQTSENEHFQPNYYDWPGVIGFGTSGETSVDADMWSAFASATWNLSDSLRVIGGVRYVEEEKDAVARPEGSTVTSAYNRTSTNTMPELVVQWDLNSDIMLYGKLGTSAKAGGFATSGDEFDDESVIGLEFGMKSSLLEGAAEFNITAFRNEFDDLQVNSFDTSGSSVVAVLNNAGSSVSQGLEVDGRWAASEWLTLSGSLAYLDAEFDEFKTGPCPQGSAAGSCDLSGSDMPFAAKFSGNIGADLHFSMNDALELNAGVNLSYSDDYYTDGALNPVGLQGSWTKVAARIGVAASDDSWSLSLIGKNLTNEVVLNTTQPLFDRYLGYIGAPRTVTLQGVYRF